MKRNANVVAALLENFSIAEDALKTSMTSAGSALRENDKYLESIQGRISKFQAAWQSLSTTIVRSGWVKAIVSAGTAIVSTLDSIAGLAGGLGTVLLAIPAGALALKLDPIDKKIQAMKTGVKEFVGIFDIAGREMAKIQSVVARHSEGADLNSALKEFGLSRSALEYFRSLDDASKKELKFAQAVKIASLSLKDKAKSAAASAAAIVKSPVVLAIAAVASVTAAIVKGYVDLSTAIKSASDEHDRLTEKYKETANNVESLKNELRSVTDELKELENIDSPTVVQQEEISALREEIDLLNMKLQIERELMQLALIEKAEAAKDYFLTTGVKFEGGFDDSGNPTFFKLDTVIGRAEWMKSELDSLGDDIAESYRKITNPETGKIDPNSKDYKAEMAKIRELEARKRDLALELGDLKAEMLPKFNDMMLDPTLTEAESKMLDKIKSILEYDVLSGQDGGAATGVAKRASEAELKALSEGIDSVQSKTSSLSDALASLRDGSMGLSDVVDLIQEFPELAEYVDLTAEGFGNLDDGLKKVIRDSPKDVIETLKSLKDTAEYTDDQKKAIDGMISALEDMSTTAIEDVSGEFGILADAINGARKAKKDLDKELQKDDHSVGYEDRVEAFKEFRDLYKKGQVGSRYFNAYKEYFNVQDLSTKELGTWFTKRANLYSENMRTGVNAFMSEIAAANRSGKLSEDIASYGLENGKYTFKYDINRLGEFAEALDMMPEEIQDFIGAYRMFSDDFVERTPESTFKEFVDNGILHKFGDTYVTTLEEIGTAIGGTEDDARKLVEQLSQLTSENIVSSISPEIDAELKKLGEGGNVDLTFRPKVDVSEFIKSGWSEEVVGKAGDIATVFSETFSNKAGTTAINFTPIQVDSNGNFVGVLEPDKFRKYCEAVVAGARSDDLNLQIGAKFTGDNAIAEAEKEAERIHELHEVLAFGSGITIVGEDQLTITQAMIDQIYSLKGSAEETISTLVDLWNTDGVTFEAGVEFRGKQIQDVIAEASGGENSVGLELNMTVNDQEVIAQVNATAEEIEAVLGHDWYIKFFGDNTDAATKLGALKTLAQELEKNDVTVTVDGATQSAQDGMNTLLGLLNQIIANKYQTVTINYVETGAVPAHNAKGTKHAKRGPSLLGDEYSPTGSPKPELVLSGDKAYVAGLNGPELGYLNDGDVVFNNRDTRRILGSKAATTGMFQRFAGGNGLIGSLVNGVKNAFNKVVNAFKKPNNGPAAPPQKRKPYSISQVAAPPQKRKPSSASLIAENISSERYERLQSLNKDSGKTSKMGNMEGGTMSGLPSLGGSSGGGEGGGSGRGDGSGSANKKEESEFERQYKEHQHLLKMEKEKYADYIKWLEKAYQEAYAKGEIELDDYRKYAEEVFEGQKDIFKDSLNDIEHQIENLQREDGNDNKVINLYLDMIKKVEAEIQAAKDRGLNENDDWIQELQGQLNDYKDSIKDIQDEIKENAEGAVKDLIDYRIKMLKQELQDQRDALKDKLSDLKDFYSKQKEMLQDAYDEEKKLEERNEKQKKKSDIEAEIAALEFDDSAWAEKRRLELKEQLAAADKDLQDFEKDNALEDAKDLLDKMYEQQEEQINKQIEAIEEKLNDPKMLYNQALKDIQNNTKDLFLEMVKYNDKHGSGNSEDVLNMWNESKESLDRFLSVFGKAYKDIIMVAPPAGGYASGTRFASRGIHKVDERGPEWVFQSADGNKYRVFSGGEKVLNAAGTNFLYDFAMSRGRNLVDIVGSHNIVPRLDISGGAPKNVNITTGDIHIHGNADMKTVSEIRRAQREGIDYILKEFTNLSR